jgi:hypothetical protein
MFSTMQLNNCIYSVILQTEFKTNKLFWGWGIEKETKFDWLKRRAACRTMRER